MDRPTLFRKKALAHYLERQKQDVLLRLLLPRFQKFMWVFFGWLFLAGCIAWNIQIPNYITVPAIVQLQERSSPSILLFLPMRQRNEVQLGQTIFLTGPNSGVYYQASVETIASFPLTPSEIQAHYVAGSLAFQCCRTSLLVSQSSVVVSARLKTDPFAHFIARDNVLNALVQIGSQNMYFFLSRRSF